MFPYIYIGEKAIPVYMICSLTGAAALFLASLIFAKKRGTIPPADIVYMLIYGGIGCLIGAKLLFIIVAVASADVALFAGKSLGEIVSCLLTLFALGGLVFYGGLIGAALGVLRYCKRFGLPAEEAFETVVPAVPLFHFFGRIGCFAAGCCCGTEYHGRFFASFVNADGVPRVPVQLFEAAGNLLLFLLLAALLRKNDPRLSLSGLYLTCYGAMRFALEFLRGDEIRGRILFFSVSQWISLAALAAGTAAAVNKYRSRNKLTARNS